MAIVNLTTDNVENIVGCVHEIFNHERLPLLEKPIEVPDIGDEVYSWLISRENNKKVIEALPQWHKPRIKHMSISVNIIHNGDMSNDYYVPTYRLSLKEDWHLLSGCAYVDIPFAEEATWNNGNLRLVLKDTDKVPQGLAGDFIKQLFAIAKAHVDIDDKIAQAIKTVREFLGQHRTLQTALKECPAIMSYVTEWMKQELNRVPPKRVRRPPMSKAEKKEIDMSQLVTQATIAKLNL